MAEKRFEKIYTQSDDNSLGTVQTEIWKDKITGVQYLWHRMPGGSGLAVLVDKDGKPVIE